LGWLERDGGAGRLDLKVRPLQARDDGPISKAFAAIGWNKPAPQYRRYFAEQQSGCREAFVASLDDEFVGYATLVWQPDYPPFREAGIPDIQDLNVLPRFQRRGIASHLMDEAERVAACSSSVVGIGVGVTEDYGAAQLLYVLRGYVPDGRGL